MRRVLKDVRERGRGLPVGPRGSGTSIRGKGQSQSERNCREPRQELHQFPEPRPAGRLHRGVQRSEAASRRLPEEVCREQENRERGRHQGVLRGNERPQEAESGGAPLLPLNSGAF